MAPGSFPPPNRCAEACPQPCCLSKLPAADGWLPDRALLEARRDLLLLLLDGRNLLVAMFPRLLVLSLAFRSEPDGRPQRLRRLCFASSCSLPSGKTSAGGPRCGERRIL